MSSIARFTLGAALLAAGTVRWPPDSTPRPTISELHALP